MTGTATQPLAPPGTRDADQVRAGENFPVALRILPRVTRHHLHALYRYARYVDDLGDEPALGMSAARRTAELDALEAQVRLLYQGEPVEHPAVSALAPTVLACRLPAQPLLRLVEANRVDQVVTRYPAEEDLLRYCALSANPVGELVLHVFGQAGPARVALSDRICTALQLIEHLQDLAEDHSRGRVYLPQADLDRFGVREDELAGGTAGAALRELIRSAAGRAYGLLEEGAPLLADLHGWARLAVGGYLAGGRATLRSLRRSGYDPLPGPPRPRRRDVFGYWLAATLRCWLAAPLRRPV